MKNKILRRKLKTSLARITQSLRANLFVNEQDNKNVGVVSVRKLGRLKNGTHPGNLFIVINITVTRKLYPGRLPP